MGGSASVLRAVPADGSGEVPPPRGEGAGVGTAWPAAPARRSVRRVGTAPAPGGPGRARPVRRSSAARPVPVRPVRGPAGAGDARPRVRRTGRARAVAGVLLAAVATAVTVFALGLLGDEVRAARVPDTVGPVQVRGDESLWQVARRAAPSADPGAVAARIVELNDLASPSVHEGEVLLSPIG